MKKNLIVFGGTSGLGKALCDKYTADVDNSPYQFIYPIGSSIVNLADDECSDVLDKIFDEVPPDDLIFFSNFTINGFLHKQSVHDIEMQIKTNILGGTLVINKALQLMRKRKYGRIIIASSIVEEKTVGGTSIYAACKGYYETFVKNIACENAALGITANCLKLGYMDGGLTYTHLTDEFRKSIVNEIPSKRLGSIDELYSSINFLIGNEYVNGSIIRIAGGL